MIRQAFKYFGRSGAVITAVALGLLLTACQGITSSRGDYAPGYRVGELALAARNDGVPLTVTGNPLGMSDAQATAVTAELFRAPGWAPAVHFRPREVYDGGYGVVLAFDPPPSSTPMQACGVQFGQDLPQESRGEDHQVIAAFCNGGPISSMRASFGPVTGPDDPTYRALLRQISLTLFPAYNPEMRDYGDGAFVIAR